MSKNDETTSPSTTPSSVGTGSTGAEMIDQMLTDQNALDRFLDRSPLAAPYSDQELLEFVRHQRALRANWNVKLEKRAMKKQGVEE